MRPHLSHARVRPPRRERTAFLMLVAVAACVPLVAAPDARNDRDAPFQVVAFSTTHVRVDVGAVRAGAESLRRATILTEAGPVAATLVGTRRDCEWLCGEDEPESKTCHYEAILRASALPARPLAVLPGRRAVDAVRMLPVGAEQPIESEQRWLDAAPFVSVAASYRWQSFPDGAYLSSSDAYGRDFYAPPIALARCTQRAIGPFTLLTCGGPAEFLYEGRNAIVFSLGEYATASARPVLRFTLDGTDAVLIRLGLKAEEIGALLIRDGASWRLAARSADYALLC